MSKLDDIEFVEKKIKLAIPFEYKSVLYRIVESKKMGAFRHITIEYAHSDTVTDGPKLE